MLQIPKRALPSTASVRVPLEGDYGGEFAEPVAIGHVRYEKAAGIRRTDYQLQDGTTGIVFIDAVNSEGAFEVPASSMVSIDGAPEVCVNACHPREQFAGRVHHWELEVR